ncbi:MAG: glycoside hydrolase family 97 protein, partial [Hymenobacter sp.]
MSIRYLIVLVSWLLASRVFAQKPLTLRSPDGQLTFRFRLTPQAPVYTVAFHGKPVVTESPLGLVFQPGGAWGAGLRQVSAQASVTDEFYSLPVGKASRVRNHYRQLRIALREGGPGRLVYLVVRAYDDGLAFRYEFPAQKDWTSYVLTDENSTFHLAGDPTLLTLFRPSYTTSHEGFYSRLPLSKVKADTLLDLPTLVQ